MPTYRSDVVGSLLRPASLKEARERYESGGLSDAEFKRLEDRAVNDAVALQEQARLDVISDGEMRRYAFYGHRIDAVEGFDKLGGWALPFRDEQGNELVFQRPVVASRLRRRRHLCAEELGRADRKRLVNEHRPKSRQTAHSDAAHVRLATILTYSRTRSTSTRPCQPSDFRQVPCHLLLAKTACKQYNKPQTFFPFCDPGGLHDHSAT